MSDTATLQMFATYFVIRHTDARDGICEVPCIVLDEIDSLFLEVLNVLR